MDEPCSNQALLTFCSLLPPGQTVLARPHPSYAWYRTYPWYSTPFLHLVQNIPMVQHTLTTLGTAHPWCIWYSSPFLHLVHLVQHTLGTLGTVRFWCNHTLGTLCTLYTPLKLKWYPPRPIISLVRPYTCYTWYRPPLVHLHPLLPLVYFGAIT